MRKILAFTLAEVLITLGIIGIVAAITIPTVVQKQQEKATVTALKKAYSELSQAYTMAVQENGPPDTWDLTIDGIGANKILQTLAPYLKITKNCGTSSGCMPTDTYKYLDGTDFEFGSFDTVVDYGKAQLQDGTLLLSGFESPNCSAKKGESALIQNVCGYIYVDINGYKKPNQYGVDWFSFYISNIGVAPVGTSTESGVGSFENSCKNKASHTGYGCTAWVLYNENTDYLKPCGSTLSWSGPTSCN